MGGYYPAQRASPKPSTRPSATGNIPGMDWTLGLGMAMTILMLFDYHQQRKLTEKFEDIIHKELARIEKDIFEEIRSIK